MATVICPSGHEFDPRIDTRGEERGVAPASCPTCEARLLVRWVLLFDSDGGVRREVHRHYAVLETLEPRMAASDAD